MKEMGLVDNHERPVVVSYPVHEVPHSSQVVREEFPGERGKWIPGYLPGHI